MTDANLVAVIMVYDFDTVFIDGKLLLYGRCGFTGSRVAHRGTDARSGRRLNASVLYTEAGHRVTAT